MDNSQKVPQRILRTTIEFIDSMSKAPITIFSTVVEARRDDDMLRFVGVTGDPKKTMLVPRNNILLTFTEEVEVSALAQQQAPMEESPEAPSSRELPTTGREERTANVVSTNAPNA